MYLPTCAVDGNKKETLSNVTSAAWIRSGMNLMIWCSPSEPSECGWKETAVSTGQASTTQCRVSETCNPSPGGKKQKWMCVCRCFVFNVTEDETFGFDSPPLLIVAPCSCMSYHHDSRRIFIGQDNGAVVVSEANSNQQLHSSSRLIILGLFHFFFLTCMSRLS